MRILFVCLGNICRSPIAEGVMKKLSHDHKLNWEIDSAATNNYHIGEAPHKFSQQVCSEHGVNISMQLARKFSAEDFDKFDLIYAMADDVLSEIKQISGSSFISSKAILFLNELYPNENRSVTDPWYGDKDGYYVVYDEIEACCKKILSKYI